MFVVKSFNRFIRVTWLELNVKYASTSVAMRAGTSLFGLVLGLGVCFCTMKDDPIVTVKQGKLKGSVQKLLDNSSYYSFKGIPYAEPPIGELRFQAPRPPKPWGSSIREAINHGPVCPQYDMLTSELTEGSEDCLFVNVYTKSLKQSSKLPVMVYVHGGAYLSGSGDTDMYGPEFLLQHDVVLVTLNYRLEVLGFLCLDIPEVPGNAGLKDQVAAFRWIRENIAQFGGNPDDVTLFGESAGASAVTYHMLSPMSKGLFQKAISQSGVALQDWTLASDPVARAFRAGNLLGKEAKDTKELLQFLRSLPALDLIKLTMKTRTDDERYRGLPMHFVPTIEKKFAKVEAFITEKPIDALVSGKVNRVPLLVGYNSAEGMLMLGDQVNKSDVYNARPSLFVPREIVERVSKEKVEEFGARIKEFYFGRKDISNETAEAVVNLQTDLHFSYQAQRFAHFYSSFAPVFMYWFNYQSDLNVFKNALGYTHMKGACHADDLFYMFYNPLNKESYEKDEKIRQMIYDVTKYWTEFARTGKPSPRWPRYTSRGEYLVLQPSPTAATLADEERVCFWNKIYSEAGLPHIPKSVL